MHTHTHTHTCTLTYTRCASRKCDTSLNTRTRAYMQKLATYNEYMYAENERVVDNFMNINPRIYVFVHAHTHAHIHTHTRTHAHMHAHAH